MDNHATTTRQLFIGERIAPFANHRFKGELVGPDLEPFLKTLGIVIRKPRGHTKFRRDQDGMVWHEIGRIRIHPLTNNRIEVCPREGLTSYEMGAMRGAAFEAFTTETITWGFRTFGKQHIPVYESSIYLPN
jgi:hypothetical protein